MIEQIHQSVKPDPHLTIVDKLRMLLDVTKKISSSLDLTELLEVVMDTLGSVLRYDAAGIYLIDVANENHLNGERIFRSQIISGYEIGELVQPQLKLGEGFIGSVAQSGIPIICSDVSQDSRYVAARKLTKSEMVAPIISNDEVIGVFDLESDHFNAYDQNDLEVLQLLASQVAIIIEKVMLHKQLVEKKRLQGQLEVARQVQIELFPSRDPQLKGFDISGYNFPSEEVSGDYYDWVQIYDDQLGIVIADASGKGIPAALLMAFLRASLRFAAQNGYASHVSLIKANRLLWDSVENHQFVTAIYGILDSTNRTLVFANAGHNPPLLLHADNTSRFIEYGDLPLGMFEETRYHQHYLKFVSGDILVLYTDGITEAENDSGEEFGRERLLEKVIAGRNLSARKLINFIQQGAEEFAGRKMLADDCTLLIIKCEASSS